MKIITKKRTLRVFQITDDSNNNGDLSSIKSGLASIHEKKMNQQVSEKTIESKNEQADKKPKKKGLFGLFKKNK